VLKNCQR